MLFSQPLRPGGFGLATVAPNLHIVLCVVGSWMARKGARVETSLHLCQCRTTSFMYRFADEPKIVLVDPCCTPSKDRSRLPLLGRISCVWEDWCFCNLRKCLEPLKRCISTVWVILGYLAQLIYLIASQVCFWLNLYVLWFIQVALLGSVAAMARWLGTELLELTATDNERGPSWKTLVIPLSFQAFFLSLFVTFGLAFANPSASQPLADPEVLASSWTTCH